jgi:3-hydroxybutyrate dehydrogenase
VCVFDKGQKVEATRVLLADIGDSGSPSELALVIGDRLEKSNAHVVIRRCEPMDAARIFATVEEARGHLGCLNALIINTPTAIPSPVLETSDDNWDWSVETSLILPWGFMKASLPALRAGPGSSVTVVASASGIWPEPSRTADSLAKRGLVMLTQMLAVEGMPNGIRANTVCPTAEVANSSPEEVADAVAFHVSPKAPSSTGSVLMMDYGRAAAVRATDVLSSMNMDSSSP